MQVSVPEEELEESNEEQSANLMEQDDVIPDTKLSEVEKLCSDFMADPSSRELRSRVEATAKKLYLKTGGLPIIRQNPLPVDLTSVSPEHLINIIDNMIIHVNRTRKADMVSKCINIVSNLGAMLTASLNISTDVRVFHLVNEDLILRESLCAVVMGRQVSPSPTVCLIISAISHLSNFFVPYFTNGQLKSIQLSDDGNDNRPERPNQNSSNTETSGRPPS